MSNSFAKHALLLSLSCYTLYTEILNAESIERYVLPKGITEIRTSTIGDPGSIVSGPLGKGLIFSSDGTIITALDSLMLANQIIANQKVTLASVQGVFSLINNNTFASLDINASGYTGTVFLKGNNTIGSLHIVGGTLCLDSPNSIGGGDVPLITMEGGTTLLGVKTFSLSSPIKGTEKVTLASQESIVTFAGDGVFSLLEINGDGYQGTVNLSGINSISSITLSSGTLSLGQEKNINAASIPSITIKEGATLLGTATLCLPNPIFSADSAVLASSRGIVTFSGDNIFSTLNINGQGYERIVALTGTNTISSRLNILSGTLAINSSDNINGSGASPIHMNQNTTLLSRGSTTLPNSIWGNSGCVTIASSKGAIFTLGGDNIFQGLDINKNGCEGIVELTGTNTIEESSLRVFSGTLAIHSTKNIQTKGMLTVELRKDATLLSRETCTVPYSIKTIDSCSLSAQTGACFTVSSNNIFTELAINTGGYKGTVSLTGINAVSALKIDSGTFSLEALENINSAGTPPIQMATNTTLLGAKNLTLPNQITASGSATFAAKEGTFALSGDNVISELHIQGHGLEGCVALSGLNSLYSLFIDSGSLSIEASQNINGAGIPSIHMNNNTKLVFTKEMQLCNPVLPMGAVTLATTDNVSIVLSSNNTFSTLNLNGAENAGIVNLQGINEIGAINLLSGVLAITAERNINKGTPPTITLYPGSALLSLDTVTLPNTIFGSSVVAITAAKGTLTLSGSNTFSHLLINGGGGSGTVRLSGMNNAIDALHIHSGCLSIESPNNINSTKIPTISMVEGSALQITNSMELPNRIIASGSVRILIGDYSSLVLSGENRFSTLELIGTGKKSIVSLSGKNQISQVHLSYGTLAIHSLENINNGSIPNIIMDRESMVLGYGSLTLPNVIHGTENAILSSTSGVFTLSNNNSFSALDINDNQNNGTIALTGSNAIGSINIRSGTLAISSANSLNRASEPKITMHPGSTLLATEGLSLPNTIDALGRVRLASSQGIFTLSTDNSFSTVVINGNDCLGTLSFTGSNEMHAIELLSGTLLLHSQENINARGVPLITMEAGSTLQSKNTLVLPNPIKASGGVTLAAEKGTLTLEANNLFSDLYINGNGYKGTVKLSGINRIKEQLTIGAGTLEISAPQAINGLGAPPIYMQDQSTFLGRGKFVLSNPIRGEGIVTLASDRESLIFSGNGTFSSLRINGGDFIGKVYLSGKNAIHDNLHILSGTLLIATEQSINAGGLPKIRMEKGTTLLATDKAILDNVILSKGSLTLSSRRHSLTVSSNNIFDTLHINGGNSLGTVTLTGKNTISRLEIHSGVLAMGTPESINANQSVNVVLNGGDLLVLSNSEYSSSGCFTAHSGGLSAAGDTVFTLNMPITASKGLFIGRAGNGVVKLSKKNAIEGEIVIGGDNHSGALSIQTIDSLGNPTSITLQEKGKFIVTESLALAESMPIYLKKMGGSFIAQGTVPVLSIPGPIYGNVGDDLVLGGGGTIVLQGRNRVEGNVVVIDNTTLKISSLSHVGANSSEAYVMLNSGNLHVTDSSIEFNRALCLKGTNTIHVDAEKKLVFREGRIIEETSITKTGLGAMTLLTGAPVRRNNIKVVLDVQGGEFTTHAALLAEKSTIHVSKDAILTLSHTAEGNAIVFNSSISGEGSVHVTGTAPILFPSSSHSHTGGTRVTGILHLYDDVSSAETGTLGMSQAPLIGGGGTVVSLGSFETSRAILLEQGTDTVFSSQEGVKLELSGTIGGSGGFIKEGPGHIILSGTSSFTGKTYVNSGTLNVAGNIVSSPDPIVYDGAILVGTGAVGDTVVYGGIKGGDPVGTLHVEGILLMEPGSSFIVALSPDGYSSVDVTDRVTINGDVSCSLAISGGAIGSSARELPILIGGSILGEFSFLSSPEFLFTEQNLLYTPQQVTLQITPISIRDLVLENNALHVANALDALVAYNRENVSYSIQGNGIIESSGGHLEHLLESLLPLHTEEEMTYALNQIQPGQLKGFAISQENNAVQVNNTVLQRLEQEVDFCPCNSSQKNTHTLWVSIIGESLTQQTVHKNAGALAGYTTNTVGSVVGWDRYFSDYFYGGALGSYTHSEVNWRESKGSGQINSGYGGLYFAAQGNLFYGSVSILGSWNNYEGKRNIVYPGVNKTANNNHTGVQLLSHVNVGLNISSGRFSVRPFDSFDYITQTEKGYQEEGAGDWNLTVSKNNAILARNELGFLFSYCFTTIHTKWDIQPKCSWVREARVKGDKITVDLQGAESPFTITGYFPNRSLVAPGLAITGLFYKDFLSLNLYYNGEFGSGYKAHNYGGRVNFYF